MLWLPHSGQIKVVDNGGIVGGWIGATVSSGTANNYGSVTEILASGSNIQDSWGIFISLQAETSPGATATQGVCDILIGGATDDMLISSLILGGASRSPSHNYFFPLHIPAGLRLAAQISCNVVRTFHVFVALYGGGHPAFRVGRKVTTLGTKQDNSRGVALSAPGTSGGTATATQIVASTSDDYFALYPGFQINGDTSWATERMNVGIGIGASTEQRVGTWWYGTTSTEEIFGPVPSLPAFCAAPSGSRLTLLCSNSGSNETNYDGLIYAVS